MPTWAQPLAEQLWSFIAVALAVNTLGTVSKRIADRMGWRKYRRSDVAKVVEAARGQASDDSGDIPLPDDASWYDITLRAHPLIAGALFGLLPLPTLEVIEGIAKDPEAGPYALIAARAAWFMLAGALSGQVYEVVKFAFTEGRARVLALIGRAPTRAPAAPASPAPPKTPDPAPSEDVSSGNEDR